MSAKLNLVSQTLLMAVEEQGVTSGEIAFLRAVALPGLPDHAAEQSFAPLANAVPFATPELALADDSHDAVLILATRSAEENKALLGKGWAALKTGGRIIIAQHNDLGAKRLDALVKQLSGEVSTVSKHHCRAVIGVKKEVHVELVERWRSALSPSVVPDTDLIAAPGMFSWRGVDRGSRLLMDTLPTLHGNGADIAAGWGYLSAQLLQGSIKSVALYEAEYNALTLARRNVVDARASFHWCDAARPLPGIPAGGFDWAVSNPPAHDLLDNAPDMTAAIFSQAASALRKGAPLYLVANRQLPYEQVLSERFSQVEKLVETPEFKVLKAVR